MVPSGYSGTPLAKKLGIKDRFKIRLVNQPAYYFDLFTDLPENVEILTNKKIQKTWFTILQKKQQIYIGTYSLCGGKFFHREFYGSHGQKKHQK